MYVPVLDSVPFPKISPIHIHPDGVAELPHNLKSHKAAGPNNLKSNQYQALGDEQHGFWQHRSCEIQLITTVHDFAQCLNQRGQCDILLLDFYKAFDKVPTPAFLTNYTFMVFKALS